MVIGRTLSQARYFRFDTAREWAQSFTQRRKEPLSLIFIFFIQMMGPGTWSATWGLITKVLARSQAQSCPTCQMPVEDHFLNFAYFVESNDLTSTLVLNNNTNDPQSVRLHL